MRFWHAINEGRALLGLPEALFGNVHAMWMQAMQVTQTEFNCAALRGTTPQPSAERIDPYEAQTRANRSYAINRANQR
jgi:hypothetical protein